ncbi:MAG: hypothetical protein AMXMBFR47_32650 [Planctomycetota bacterium]
MRLFETAGREELRGGEVVAVVDDNLDASDTRETHYRRVAFQRGIDARRCQQSADHRPMFRILGYEYDRHVANGNRPVAALARPR